MTVVPFKSRVVPVRLTREERHTLGLVALELSNLEICELTGLSVRVVKAHLRRAAELSGRTGRRELAAWAVDPDRG